MLLNVKMPLHCKGLTHYLCDRKPVQTVTWNVGYWVELFDSCLHKQTYSALHCAADSYQADCQTVCCCVHTVWWFVKLSVVASTLGWSVDLSGKHCSLASCHGHSQCMQHYHMESCHPWHNNASVCFTDYSTIYTLLYFVSCQHCLVSGVYWY